MNKYFDFFPEDDLSVDVINGRLKLLFKFYKDNGYEISINDFKDIFNEKSYNYKVDNEYIYKYMNLFFNDNGDTNYFQLISQYGIKVMADPNVNPMYETIKRAITIFNNKHIALYEVISEGIYKFINNNKEDSLDNNKELVHDNVESVSDDIVKDDSLGEQNNDNMGQVESLDDDNDNEDIYSKLCKMLGNNELNNDNLLLICDFIIRCNLYSSYQDVYLEYSKENNYQDVLREINRLKGNIDDTVEKNSLINDKLNKVKNKKVNIFYSLNKKNEEIVRLGDEINYLLQKKSILEDKILNLKREYIGRFYYNNKLIQIISNLSNNYKIDNLSNVEKLFGIFEFEDLPLDMKKINNISIVKDNNVIIPDLDSSEFMQLVKLSFDYLSLNNKKNIK